MIFSHLNHSVILCWINFGNFFNAVGIKVLVLQESHSSLPWIGTGTHLTQYQACLCSPSLVVPAALSAGPTGLSGSCIHCLGSRLCFKDAAPLF